jgi:four helix bundle protein
MGREYNLEDRLILFATNVSGLMEKVPKTITGKYLSHQIIRSAMSPALNYGEAKSAESRNDFIHKMKIALKELRETHVGLMILKKAAPTDEIEVLNEIIRECNELIAIFVKCIQTASSNKGKE